MIIVSACLVGDNCKYNGKNNENDAVLDFLKGKKYIKICPEVLGGLRVPRSPAEIKEDKVINSDNEDVTENYLKGARLSLKAAIENNAGLIILKSKSPSCGLGRIYDGTFTGILTEGNGITCQMLLDNGFKVITENDLKGE